MAPFFQHCITPPSIVMVDLMTLLLEHFYFFLLRTFAFLSLFTLVSLCANCILPLRSTNWFTCFACFAPRFIIHNFVFFLLQTKKKSFRFDSVLFYFSWKFSVRRFHLGFHLFRKHNTKICNKSYGRLTHCKLLLFPMHCGFPSLRSVIADSHLKYALRWNSMRLNVHCPRSHFYMNATSKQHK